MSRDFGLFLFEEKSNSPTGQVDLEGETIYNGYLIGFWADLDGVCSGWSVELPYNEIWKIRSSCEFTFNKDLFSD